MADDLTKMIDALVEQKTFGLDAIEGVKALRDKAADQEKKLAAASVSITESAAQMVKLNGTVAQRDATIAEWQKREADLRTREAKMTELEKSVAVEQAKSGAINSCFDKIFQNRTVRENVQNNIPTVMPPSYSGGMATTQWNTETKDITREER